MRIVREAGKPIAQVARELEVDEGTLASGRSPSDGGTPREDDTSSLRPEGYTAC